MKKPVKFLFFACIVFVVVISFSQAQTVFKPDQILSPDPQILIGKLKNGLTYYIRENKKPEKRAELRVVVKAGSVLEQDNEEGIAHFLEHMAFNGTTNFSKQALVNYLEKCGVKFGSELNAYTSFDETVYMLQVPTDSLEVFNNGFKILKDWSHNISFDKEEINKERGVILEEERVRRSAYYRIWMKQAPYLLHKSRYAERMPIGKKEDIEKFTYEQFKQFYSNWYRPNLMAVIAVGDFDKKEVEKIIIENFSELKNPTKEISRENYTIPKHKETLVSIETDEELTQSSVSIIFKRQTSVTKTASDYRKYIIANLYDAMLNARMTEISRQPNAPFVYAYVGADKWIKSVEMYSIYAVVKENSIMGGFEAALKEAYRVKQHGFTATELERAKSNVLRRMEKAVAEKDKTESATHVSEYTRNFLVEETIPGIEAEFAMYKQYLPTITVEEVNALVNKNITDENRVITIAAPKKETIKMPTESEVLALYNKVSTEKLEPYLDNVIKEELMSKIPAAGKVIEEKKMSAIGVTEWKLSNGAKVVLKPTDFKKDEILFAATSNGGSSLVGDTDFISANYAASIVNESGVGKFDKTMLQKKLAGKTVSVNPSIIELFEGFNGSTSPKDIEAMLQLAHLYITEPRVDSSAFISFTSRIKEMIKNRSLMPEIIFNDTLQATISNYHTRRLPLTEDAINKISLKKVGEIYKDRFADCSDFTFFFVGSFNVDSIKPLVEKYLASLPSINRKENWKDIGVNAPKGVVSKEIYKGIEDKSFVNVTFTGQFECTQKNRHTFNSMIEALNIKLREVLREDKGGTYGVSISGTPRLIPRQEYSVSITWGCNPQRVDELVKELFLQLDSLKLKPINQSYVDKVKEMQRRSYEVNLKTNRFWVNNLKTFYERNDNPEEYLANLPKFTENLTATDLHEAMKKYLDFNNYVKVVLYPEKKK